MATACAIEDYYLAQHESHQVALERQAEQQEKDAVRILENFTEGDFQDAFDELVNSSANETEFAHFVFLWKEGKEQQAMEILRKRLRGILWQQAKDLAE